MQFESDFTFRSTNLPSRCFGSIADFKKQKKFCDVTFTVGPHRISAHRIIVAAAIPFLQDDISMEKDEVAVPDVDPGVFECLIDFAYSCELKITMENVTNILSGACHFRMDEVRDACCDFLTKRLLPENALNFRELAVKLHYDQLVDIIDHYIKDRFTEISETEDFLNYPFDYIKELVGMEDLQVDSEERVLDAVLKWVRASTDDRKDSLTDLLRKVRMPLMAPLCLTDIAEGEKLIWTSLENRNLIDEARNFNLFPERRKDTCSFPTQPRKLKTSTASSQDMSKQCIYSVCIDLKYHVCSYDFTSDNALSSYEKDTYVLEEATIAELNNKIYLFHWGYAWEYDRTTDRNQCLASPTVPRIYSGASSLKGRIYVCGGNTGGEHTSNVVECFDPDVDEWMMVSPMRAARSQLCTVTLGEYIYALGGKIEDCVHNSVERYPSVTGKWQTMAPMLCGRYAAAATSLNGRIYVCGGKADGNGDCVATAEVYDPIRNKWKFISPLNRERSDFALVSYGGKLYTLGGLADDGDYLDTVEVYDPKEDKWSSSQISTASASKAVIT